MDWVEAVVTVVTALIWPVAVVTIVVLLRRQLTALIGRMSRLNAVGVEAEFSHEAAATAELAEATLPEPPNTVALPSSMPLTPHPTLDQLLLEAKGHPIGAMVRAWQLLETLAPFDEDGRIYLAKLERVLGSKSAAEEVLPIYRRLAGLWSREVRGRAIPTVEDAEEFVSTTWRLYAYLLNLKNSPKRPEPESS